MKIKIRNEVIDYHTGFTIMYVTRDFNIYGSLGGFFYPNIAIRQGIKTIDIHLHTREKERLIEK
jgi:hypothetical protein